MVAQVTIDLPEELQKRAEARAALEGTTFSEVIRKRLEEFAQGWDAIEDAADSRAVAEFKERVARGEEKLWDWADVDAELDSMPD